MVRRAWIGVLLLALVIPWLPVPVGAQQAPPRLLGEYSFPSKGTFQDTVVGGLSGIAYDAARGVYYAVCDDRGEHQPPRFYTLEIDLDLNGIRDVRIVGVTTLDSDLNTAGIQPYDRNDSDLEEIVLLPNDELLITSERDRNNRPWIRRFALDGSLLGELPTPTKFQPIFEPDSAGRNVIVRGTRNNVGFEGITVSPDATTMYVVNEEALGQDGPLATVSVGTNVRIVEYGLRGRDARPDSEYVYQAERVFAEPNPPTAFADNGVSAILWIRHLMSRFDLLVMERSFATGVGNDVNIYGVRLTDAEDVSRVDPLPSPFTGRAVQKTRLVNMAELGISADNLEGMALGPTLPNGKPSLLVISDDNFSQFDPPQVNQFILFELDAAPSR
jgi:3-phytase